MAKYHYDLTGAEPIIRDVPVTDSATLAKGEFIMREGSDSGRYAEYITGYIGGAAEMVKGLGIMNETITTTSVADWGDDITTAATTATAAISSIASTVTLGSRYGKAIINPFMVYLTERDQSSSAYITAVATSASATVTDTLEDEFDGGWFYCVSGVGPAANQGHLRYITASNSTTSATLLSAWTTTTANKIIKILPNGHDLIGLDATAIMTSDLTAHTAPSEIYLCNVESYIGGQNKPLEPLRAQVHNGIQDTNAKFYNDIILKDHMYNSIVV